uniref:Uncharacterized protein n=1 Tax=Aegilops tauschii subsp. strangulata TaxID=200361 RepID=A0A453I8W2_AEGTS
SSKKKPRGVTPPEYQILQSPLHSNGDSVVGDRLHGDGASFQYPALRRR